ncbi:YueI family protein [Streptococcus dentiloxodontae]
MENLNQKVLKAATGEKRLNPDEQRHYLGTFAERVVLAILLENTSKPQVKEHFKEILKELIKKYEHLAIKLSPKLDDTVQFYYIKTAQTMNIQATIVDEAKSDSPYGLIIHSNKAENLTEILYCKLYPKYIFYEEKKAEQKKQGFFAKLFSNQK